MLDKDENTTTHVKSEAKNAALVAHALNLKPLWQHTQNILAQLRCPERAAEVFLLSDPLLTCQIEIHRLVEDTLSALPKYIHRGYTLAVEPFRVSAGRCAVIQDSCGTRICLFEKTRIHSFSA
jgi:hypothetical protein